MLNLNLRTNLSGRLYLESRWNSLHTDAMKFKQSDPLGQRLLLGATLMGALCCSIAAQAQVDVAKPDSRKPLAVLPLEESASRGISTRDPSSIVKCKDEYWVFYTGRGVPSYHSKDLVKWERGPAVFKTAPEWIATTVPENRNMSCWAPDIMKVGDQYLLY